MHEHHNHTPEEHTAHTDKKKLNKMAALATLHCLAGCAIGEVLGLIIGTALGFPPLATVALAIFLAFVFGFGLSTLPLIRAGMTFFSALSVVFVADTLSITTMEIVNNGVMLAIPGAMHVGLSHPLFWVSMVISLGVAYLVTFPVNRHLLAKGKGHAISMKHLGHHH